MYTKNLIQLTLEKMHKQEHIKNEVKYLMEKYVIEDAVLTLSHDNELMEVVTGYFVPNKEYDSLEEAIKNYDDTLCIRVMENKKFLIGRIYKHLSDCPDLKIFDLSKLTNI